MAVRPSRPDASLSATDLLALGGEHEDVNQYVDLLDELEELITVIDAETSRVVYANKATIEFRTEVPDFIGSTCYESIRGSSHHCEDCLLADPDGPSERSETLDYLGRVFKSIKKKIIWRGREAQLELAIDITDRTHAEEAERERERAHKKEQALIASIPGGIAIYHMKKAGMITTEYVSEGLAQICDYTAPEFLALLCDDATVNIVPEDLPALEEKIKISLTEHRPLSATYHIYKKDRTPVLIRLEANALPQDMVPADENAVYYAVHTLVSDEAKKIIEERVFFRDLLDSVPVGIGIYTVSGDNVSLDYINDAYYRMLGVARESRKAFIGTDTLDALYPDDKAIVKEVFAGLLAGKTHDYAEVRVCKSDGSLVWLSVNVAVAKRDKDSIEAHAAFFDITQSKKQQLILAENQQAVELAQERGEISIFTYNMDTATIRQQSIPESTGHMGYPAEISNVPQCFVDSDRVHPDDVELFLDIYDRIHKGAEKSDGIYRLRNATGDEYHWMHMYLQRMDAEFTEDRVIAGFSLSIDSQQEATARYHEEERLRNQMFADSVVFAEFNLTQGRCEKITSHSEVDWGEVTLADYESAISGMVEGPYLEGAKRFYAEHLLESFNRGENTLTYEYRGASEPGDPVRWYRNTAMLTQRPDSGEVLAFVYVQDVDDEMVDKIALDGSVIDGIEVISVIDVNTAEVHFLRNSGFFGSVFTEGEELIYDADFVRDCCASVVEYELDLDWTAAQLETVIWELNRRETYQFSLSSESSDGVRKRHHLRFRYLDDRKQKIVLTIDDITAVYVAEQRRKYELETALEKAYESSRDKAAFYSRMSHDMRTPMNGILGMAALSRDEEDVAVLKKNMSKIEESGQYLLSLINDTLDVQRIESGRMVLEPQIVSTKELVANIVDMVRPSADASGVEIRFDKGNTELDWYIRIDPVRMKQVLVNLLSNAVKFTPRGGIVDLSFELLNREGLVSHDVIYVRDTGVGMSEEFIKNKIFKPFSQERNELSDKYAGSGLGLSIAKNIVELMGGRMEVTSELGSGTTFTIYLDFERVPLEEAERLLSDSDEKSQNFHQRLNGKRILVVEDHPLNAEIATKILERVGCEVVKARDGQEGVTVFAGAPEGGFDAVLMDIRMPVMDGLEAARSIRSLSRSDAKTTPIIAMTANTYEEDVKASLDAGMNAHLGKPVDPQQLFETLCRFV